ncbi:hypothetical protein PROFUN_01111 [Planoprotostelium fungivorum]|uniref:Transmembrane protein n=1 Tax=Planoprotostelium fungivorum TaxID=1890364 RepID=A0A2P6NCB4_9EUKA|nr:hypothetical protein PROFUN_01111 [Planoprotostelium fungivorum]
MKNNRINKSPKRKHRIREESPVKLPHVVPEVEGPLYPLKIFGGRDTYYLGKDHTLIFSVLTALLFLIPSFRSLSQAPLWKLFPTGILALNIFRKRHQVTIGALRWVHGLTHTQVPHYADKAVMLCAVFAMHCFGDSLLAQSDVPEMMLGKSHMKNMAVSTILFGFGWLLNSVLVLTELKEEERSWNMMSLRLKISLALGMIYGLGVIGFLVKNLELEKNDGAWALLLIPYVATEIFFFASAMLAGDKMMIVGTLCYFASDTCIALEDIVPASFPLFLLSWPLYYIAQCLLFLAGTRWLQKHNQDRDRGETTSLFNRAQNILLLMGVDTSQYLPSRLQTKEQRARAMHQLARELASRNN